MKTPTRRQHYVWRYHLTAWEVSGKVAVLRKGSNGFSTNPANVTAERDFYKLPQLSDGDVQFINAFIDQLPQTEDRKEFARGWLKGPNLARSAREFAKSRGALSPDVERAIEAFEIEADEGMMGAIERGGLPPLEKLRAGDAGFWPLDDDACIAFSHFIAVQHFRTKRMADRVSAGQLPSGHEGRLNRTWPIFRHILAANVGCSIYVQRKEFRLRVVRSSGSARFITSDQPVMNLVKPLSDNDLVLYFPISPLLAVVLEHHDAASPVPASSEIIDTDVITLNGRMLHYAHEQIIGDNLDDLRKLSELVAITDRSSPQTSIQDEAS